MMEVFTTSMNQDKQQLLGPCRAVDRCRLLLLLLLQLLIVIGSSPMRMGHHIMSLCVLQRCDGQSRQPRMHARQALFWRMPMHARRACSWPSSALCIPDRGVDCIHRCRPFVGPRRARVTCGSCRVSRARRRRTRSQLLAPATPPHRSHGFDQYHCRYHQPPMRAALFPSRHSFALAPTVCAHMMTAITCWAHAHRLQGTVLPGIITRVV